MQVPIIFSIDGGGKNWGWRIERPRKFPDTIPPELHWEEAPRLRNYNPPVYPRAALVNGVEGRVEVGFLVGPTGYVLKAELIKSPSDELGEAAMAAVYSFEFEPARKDDQPCGALLNMRFDFKRSDRSDAQYTGEMIRLVKILEDEPEKLVSLGQLDRMPKPLQRKSPVTPPMIEFAEPVTVEVDFIISRRGIAELPQAQSGVDPTFAYAAIQAVSAWQFTPPEVDGEVVDAKAVVPIVFNPPSAL